MCVWNDFLVDLRMKNGHGDNTNSGVHRERDSPLFLPFREMLSGTGGGSGNKEMTLKPMLTRHIKDMDNNLRIIDAAAAAATALFHIC